MPQESTVLLGEGECIERLAPFPAAVIGTSYAPPTLSACALDVTDGDGLCPYCGQPTPHLPNRRPS